MLRKVTLSLLFALSSLVCFNKADAAFPTEKNSEKVVVQTTKTVADASSQTLSNKEAKKEVKALKKSVTSSGGKSKILAAVLAFFLGVFGVHSFYMGQTKKGALQAGLTAIGIVLFAIGIAGYVSGGGATLPVLALFGYLIILGVGIWAFVDFIRILTGGLAPEEGFDD